MLMLASASPRRRELLRQAGFAFTAAVAGVDEELLPGEAAASYVKRLAEEKAQAVWEAHKHLDSAEDPLVVLGADTCVVADGGAGGAGGLSGAGSGAGSFGGKSILGKPADAGEARRMLEMLSGRTHAVLTGLAAVTAARTVRDVEVTQVTFLALTDAEIARYVASGEAFDKAGGYGIQGYAARWIPRIEGCYFNVVGLPIARVVALLEEAERQGRGERV